jgi:hypothetical protein
MTFRALMPRDLPAVKLIHAQHYEHEFELPDFKTNYIASFAVVNEAEKIIAAGGVRAIAEVVIVTDKEAASRDKHKALYKILEASKYFANEAKFDQIHAMVKDDKWKRRLEKDGFKQCEGILLYSEV